MARHKGIKHENEKKEQESLIEAIVRLTDDVLEEFDMMELIEDEIKTIFQCDLECKTCSKEEQGICLQNFKKGNLYWLRKIAQDEKMLKEVVEDMLTVKENLVELAEALSLNIKSIKSKTDWNAKVEAEKEKRQNPMYYS
ncbi:MAG: hypothetical protein V3V14_11260 [Saprospiraceae bacterium]